DVTLYADRATYDGNTRIARCEGNIRLVRGGAVLRTQRLTYYRDPAYGYYDTGGTLTDSSNVLTSQYGYFYTREDRALFKQQVVYRAGTDYVLTTDSLRYQVDRDVAYFVDASRVRSTDSLQHMYTERGWYDAPNKEMLLWQNTWYQDTSYTLAADTLYYHHAQDSGWAHCHIQVWQNDTSAFLGAERARFLQKAGKLWLWEDPWMLQFQANDTLALYADTLFAHEDSTAGIHLLEGYHNVQFRTPQLQARAHHLRYNRADSSITLSQDPVSWSQENQVSGDTLQIWLRNQQPDSMRVQQNAFMISRADSSQFFNQIKGREVRARFRNRQLYWMQVEGNVETIYYVDDDKGALIGMNLAYCARLQAWFSDSKPIRMKMEQHPKGTFFPIHEVYLNPRTLDGFRYRVSERPTDYLLPAGAAHPAE
ncbi:MAG: OstA-like protein, partial [Sphingobacteriia bacterium]